ncbi:hypothetical protein ASPCADRAFT_4691 [Aspergillus carbonarius ITEM 5010]|uniref:Heterokaryon incompatibility domain-containing protein n=1 Tax=Aspergillus carbonarius (strain ITEM 5010) TaxID=602072 RepID=A0A1R3RQ91_ASPC5|nr:hypothetical protein ASPCADRAFT_4691 [Aspergillus carbonarius ITEM 5010]
MQAFHGHNTYYGIPFHNLEPAIGWTLDDGPQETGTARRDGWPSWSWLSHSGPIRHHDAYELALWAIPQPLSASKVLICKPSGKNSRGNSCDYVTYEHVVPVILSWYGGCVKSDPPVDLPLGYPLFQDLSCRWGTNYLNYWQDAFGQLEADGAVFSACDIETALSAPGRLLVHAQTARFGLRRPTRINARNDAFWIYHSTGGFAGFIRIPTYRQSTLTHTSEEFLLISVRSRGDTDIIYEHFAAAGIRDSNQLQYTRHWELRKISLSNPPEVWFYDPFAIVFNVMLIDRNEQTNVASRVGIGHVFLFKW